MHACREDQDLNKGAVMQAVVEEGEGEACPVSGDLVSAAQTAAQWPCYLSDAPST